MDIYMKRNPNIGRSGYRKRLPFVLFILASLKIQCLRQRFFHFSRFTLEVGR